MTGRLIIALCWLAIVMLGLFYQGIQYVSVTIIVMFIAWPGLIAATYHVVRAGHWPRGEYAPWECSREVPA